MSSAPVTLVKVDAHTGNFGNDLADCIAKQGASSGLQWAPTFDSLLDFQFLPSHGSQHPIEGDLRTYLKLQSQSIYVSPGGIGNGYSVVSPTLSLLIGTLLSLTCIKEISLAACDFYVYVL